MTLTLEYATPQAARPMRGMLRASVILAGLPLVTGVSIFLAYLATEWEALPVFGLFTLGLGPILLLVSAGLLIAYGVHSRRHRCVEGKALRRQLVLTVALMLANFPAAYVCARAGAFYVTAVKVPVVVLNQGTATAHVTLDGPGGVRKFTVASGKSWSTQLRVDGGNLVYKTIIGSVTHEGVARSWTDADEASGDSVTITITDSGTTVQ